MSEKRHIRVVLGEEQHYVGDLIFETNRGRSHSVFKYHDQWLNNPLKFALSPVMPLQYGWTSYSGDGRYSLPNPISDTSPDNWGRSIVQSDLGRNTTEIEILLAANDETRTGALRYMDEDGIIQSTTAPPVPRIPTLIDLRRLNERFERGGIDASKIARELRGSGDSLGGARPKSAIYDGDALSLAKYTSDRDSLPIEQMEVATLNLASKVGVRASAARVELADSARPVAIIQRFDRIAQGRVHYISGRSFLDLRETSQPVYYTDLVDAMRRNCGDANQTVAEIHELFKRVMFMILVSNTDDHMKNHGFLHTGADRWVLSPAFDINPQPDRHKQLNTGISELVGFNPSIEALIESAPLFDMETSDATLMATMMSRTIKESWRSACRDVGMSSRDIDRYEPAFIHHEMDVALTMNHPTKVRSRDGLTR